jgi:deoxyribodipyrimidine photo-lyase
VIHPSRVQVLNDRPANPRGTYVLYWMQASQRAQWNHALEFAAGRANELGKPLVVAFGVMDDYPEANERHYAFMLEGLRDVRAALRRRGVKFVLRHGPPHEVAIDLARRAALVVCDRGYLRHQKRWRDEVADRAPVQVVQVDTDVVVPVESASDHQEYAARTLRPKLHRLWPTYLKPLRPTTLCHPSLGLKLASDIDLTSVDAALAQLRIDRTVKRSPRFRGGSVAAHRLLDRFLRKALGAYADSRSDPAAPGTSTLAAYLHFGQISPLEVALRVKNRNVPFLKGDIPIFPPLAPGPSAYLEELLVRRELAVNFVHYGPGYDAYDALPAWARRTLQDHARDGRHRVYTRAQLEAAQTHDRHWNAAQREMVLTGYMHNSMRMYWGKQVLQWKATPREAFDDLLYLNNKYFLCGRDPNAYANVAWVFGLHDRPWGPARQVFGTVRYMNAAGLERKFDMDAYAARVEAWESCASAGGD